MFSCCNWFFSCCNWIFSCCNWIWALGPGPVGRKFLYNIIAAVIGFLAAVIGFLAAVIGFLAAVIVFFAAVIVLLVDVIGVGQVKVSLTPSKFDRVASGCPETLKRLGKSDLDPLKV